MTVVRRPVSILVAVLAALLALLPAAASAAPRQASVFMDDDLLLFDGDATADATLQELHDMGVDTIRVSVPWANMAPHASSARRPASLKDPANPANYDQRVFDLHDHLVRVAKRLDIRVLFSVVGPGPLWASGSSGGHKVNGVFKPSPAEFGKFMRMLATRYDGRHQDENQGGGTLPRVSAWALWNEPNQGAQLQPQWERVRGVLRPVAARLYRDLARAGITGLRAAGHGDDTILLGETAPRGTPDRGRTRSVRPVPFLQAFFCLNEKGGNLTGRAATDLGCSDFARRGRFAVDAFSHHPYSITAAPDVADPNPADITLADTPRLTRILDQAAAKNRIPRRLPVWFTEYGWQTDPPDPTGRGVPLADQARWLAQAEHITRVAPRVAALTQFLLRDDLPRESNSEYIRWSTYQTGLKLADGTHKPSYDAYRLPLDATPSKARPGQQVTLWGFVRPVTGAQQTNVQLEFAPEGSTEFKAVGGALAVDPGTRIFTTTVTPPASGTYRFTWTPPGGKPAGGIQLPGVGGLVPGLGGGGAPQPLSSALAPVSVG